MKLTLSSQQTQSVSRISGLVLINALIFQEVLAEHEKHVKPLEALRRKEDVIKAFSDQWEYILNEINYYPIFHLAREILANLAVNADSVNAIKELGATAQRIVGLRAALRHDLMGRVYHRLLAEAKYLGTYYTSIPAATLLLKLAVHHNQAVRWDDPEEFSRFRVADLACGTGTLLMAAAESLTDLHVRAQANKGEEIDLALLQNILLEQIIHGYDVLASALHLTASTLAMRAPQVTFRKMNLYNMPLGGSHQQLGSIEFLHDEQVKDVSDLFGASSTVEQVTGAGAEQITHASVPPLDLCIMNPPFTRSVGGNLLFGSLPDSERKKMQKRLADLIKKKKVLANSTAGLGSVFVAMADRFIKVGGRIGLVLPKALLSGVAWGKTRELLRQKYRVEYIVASQDPLRWNFSENTDLSEVLLVAVKQKNKFSTKAAENSSDDRPVVSINLWRNPTTAFEALAIRNSLPNEIPMLNEGQGATSLSVGDTKVGEAIAMRWRDLKKNDLWVLPCAFAQTDITRTAYELMRGKLKLPGKKGSFNIPLSSLGLLGTLGPDRRDIHDGFNLSTKKTAFPSFWGHDSSMVLSMEQQPNNYLVPLAKAKPGRNLRKLDNLWPLAGRVIIVERLRVNTQRFVAVRLTEPVLSNMWWSFFLKKKKVEIAREKALVLWLNSTLGLITLLANREETEGAWIDFKKPVLASLPTLNVEILSANQIERLALLYDKVCTQSLLPLPRMSEDPVRAKVDQAIAKTLKLPDFSILRELLAQEPVVCLNRI